MLIAYTAQTQEFTHSSTAFILNRAEADTTAKGSREQSKTHILRAQINKSSITSNYVESGRNEEG